MKKYMFLAATAALALASCSSDELVQVQEPEVLDNAVSFSAYAGRETRAISVTNNELGANGFGVFAFEQGPVKWDTYRAGNTYPNFMYNQKVYKEVTTAASWAFKETTSFTLADYMRAPKEYQDLFETPTAISVADGAKFTSEEKNILSDAEYLGTEDWTGSGAENTYGGSETLTFDEFKALAIANKLKKFAASITEKTGITKPTVANEAEYNALSPEKQAYFTYTTPAVSGEWLYNPKKYFSNNEDALHSFFAYAPYQADVKSVFTDKGPAVRYNITDNYDLLWAGGNGNPADSKKSWYDIEKPDVSKKIALQFNHALSKVSVDATYFADEVHTGGHTETGNLLDENTKVVIRSVKFIGQVPSQGLLSLYDGSWTYEKIEEGALEMMTGTTFTWDGSVDASGDYKPIKNDMMVIPTQTGDHVNIQIVYDVITVDPKNPKNNSTVTNTITSGSNYELVAGNAYKFHLDLGLTSVKFTATVDAAGWGTDVNNYVDLPNNDEPASPTPSNRR